MGGDAGAGHAGADTTDAGATVAGADTTDAGADTADADTTDAGADTTDADTTDDFELAGVPDSFQRLWTPYRMAYIKAGQDQVTGEDDCPFCRGPQREDAESLIVHRGRTAFVVLNLFPYNSGHLLVCPYRHVPNYTDITDEETAEIAALTQQSMRVLRQVARPTGFNLGMNQGVSGGAGIAAHLHQHVVPRWGGDGNFFPIIAQTKAIPATLGDVRESLAAAWPAC